MNGGLISYICLRCHLRRKRHARAGSGIGAKCRTECFRGELRIRFRLDLRLFLCVDGRTIPRACFRRAADICRDNRAIQSVRQRNRCARELRIEASYIARGNSRLSAGRDGRSRPRQRADDALCSCPSRSLPSPERRYRRRGTRRRCHFSSDGQSPQKSGHLPPTG